MGDEVLVYPQRGGGEAFFGCYTPFLPITHIYAKSYTAFLAYKHAPYIQLYCVCNLILIQRKLNLWNVHMHDKCTGKEGGCTFSPAMF